MESFKPLLSENCTWNRISELINEAIPAPRRTNDLFSGTTALKKFTYFEEVVNKWYLIQFQDNRTPQR